MDAIVPVEVIEGKIYLIRGQKVMLDSDLANLYGVETFNLNKAVKKKHQSLSPRLYVSAYIRRRLIL